PMVNAFKAGKRDAAPVIPKTLITILATGDPGYSYNLLYDAVKSDGGTMIAIEDGKTFEAMRRLASKAGFSVEPATAVAFAGLEQMLADGTIAAGETVVVNCSGHTFTAESHILGDQYVLDLQLNSAGNGAGKEAQEEGLDAAIRKLDEQVTSILIVDDNATDRRLIRRLLQRYKRYRIDEADSGLDALKAVRDRKPDFIITDLTMPEMDGFTLLEKLKHDPETKDIPVVVVSAKTITENDSKLLNEYSESVWMKGGFDTRQLVNHVVNVLEQSSLGEKLEPLPATFHSQDTRTKPEAITIVETNGDAVKHSVVIIEDNPQDLRLARRLLESEGSYRIIEASSGRAGLKAIYEHRPELIILDLMLPEMDGFSVLEALQSDHKLRDIPVLVLSAKELTIQERQTLEPRISSLVEKASLDRGQFLYLINDILK
ncbi:MAG: pyridoxal-phosphate dependent enzyme, partial [Anaerolineae bacterium]|nr:pyridoxal-phosphate dependent enzyme [Anaerolineae bacterium]